MFCPLESLELKVDTCPVSKCMYKGLGGKCCHDVLTAEGVTVVQIALVRGEKAYKIKSQAASSKHAITLGLTIAKYVEFIKDSFPVQEIQTVNKRQNSHLDRVLENTFSLSPHQHQYFWNNERFNVWKTRLGLSVTYKEVRQALLAASST